MRFNTVELTGLCRGMGVAVLGEAMGGTAHEEGRSGEFMVGLYASDDRQNTNTPALQFKVWYIHGINMY